MGQLDVGHRLTVPVPQMIHRAMPGNGGGPGAELLVVSAERVQVSDHLQPRLRGHVLGLITNEHTKIAQQSRLDRSVQAPKRRFITELRLVDLGAIHREIVTYSRMMCAHPSGLGAGSSGRRHTGRRLTPGRQGYQPSLLEAA